jgi:hypothetical protein
MFSLLTINKWSDSRHKKTRNDFLMDSSPVWRTYIVKSEALYPPIILLGKRRDLTITLSKWEVCYTLTHRQLNPTLSLIRSRCKNDIHVVDRIAPSITIHGKDPVRLVLVEAWYSNTSLLPILHRSQYQVYTYFIPGKNQSWN